MTAYEIIMVCLAVISLLISSCALLLALITFLGKLFDKKR